MLLNGKRKYIKILTEKNSTKQVKRLSGLHVPHNCLCIFLGLWWIFIKIGINLFKENFEVELLVLVM